jgi:predicted DNA binding CopG/RHH family protein
MSKTTAENLEARFDAGEDVLDYFDPAASVRRNHLKSRVNLDLPAWLLARLDRHASRHGVPRQALVKLWLAERLAAEEARGG